MDVLAVCPAMVGGQGPCSKTTASSARCPHRIRQFAGCVIEKNMHTDQLDWSLPAHRRGTLRGMDAA
ncbi:hypothetical protein FPL04_06695 [Xanthomonas arboricola]|nr:hypothetical protein FPL04_06695 [Xanthomonas arboricola]